MRYLISRLNEWFEHYILTEKEFVFQMVLF